MANNEPLRNLILSVTSGNTDGSCYHQNNGYNDLNELKTENVQNFF